MRPSQIAARDDVARSGSPFRDGGRPVIRWIKGDGADDAVTRAAIGQATRLFGDRVDYCLCTQGLDAARARDVLAWAVAPVEWMPVGPADNPTLADALTEAGCAPERFGYWWKWFPERVRPGGPEWILDGDMVITAAPPWFNEWAAGTDVVRMSQDDRSAMTGLNIYGQYAGSVDAERALYSGLVSLPPGVRYMPEVMQVLGAQPLIRPHDGIDDMSEQGVMAAAFDRLDAQPIPLTEFPFGRAFEPELDFGLGGDQGRAWGYHFGYSFRQSNPHFERLSARGTVLSPRAVRSPWVVPRRKARAERDRASARYRWLSGGTGQWGVPGWGMDEDCARAVLDEVARFRGAHVLEIGTSRGRLAAMMSSLGCRVTTVDHIDRHAARNLAGLPIDVVVEDAPMFLDSTHQRFDLICVDVHGNAPDDWLRLHDGLLRCLAPGGSVLVNNAELWRLPEWRDETGVREFLRGLGPEWTVRHLRTGAPGVAMATRGAR